MKQIFNNFIATLRRYKVSSILNILGLGVRDSLGCGDTRGNCNRHSAESQSSKLKSC